MPFWSSRFLFSLFCPSDPAGLWFCWLDVRALFPSTRTCLSDPAGPPVTLPFRSVPSCPLLIRLSNPPYLSTAAPLVFHPTLRLSFPFILRISPPNPIKEPR